MRLHRVPPEVADLLERVEALEEWKASIEEAAELSQPGPYKPIRKNEPLDSEPVDAQAMWRDASEDFSNGFDWGEQDWTAQRNGYL